MENQEYNNNKRFWHILEFLKYILECKACIPFSSRDENFCCAYKKPSSTDIFYEKANDMKDFENDPEDIQKELQESVKVYHTYRKQAEEISKANMTLSNLVGGQITLAVTMFKSFIRCTNVQAKWTVLEDQSFTKKIDNNDVFKLDGNKGVIGCECGCVLNLKLYTSENNYISINTYAYPDPHNKAVVLSFLECTIESKNSDPVIKELESKRDIIPRIPLQHCF